MGNPEKEFQFILEHKCDSKEKVTSIVIGAGMWNRDEAISPAFPEKMVHFQWWAILAMMISGGGGGLGSSGNRVRGEESVVES